MLPFVSSDVQTMAVRTCLTYLSLTRIPPLQELSTFTELLRGHTNPIPLSISQAKRSISQKAGRIIRKSSMNSNSGDKDSRSHMSNPSSDDANNLNDTKTTYNSNINSSTTVTNHITNHLASHITNHTTASPALHSRNNTQYTLHAKGSGIKVVTPVASPAPNWEGQLPTPVVIRVLKCIRELIDLDLGQACFRHSKIGNIYHPNLSRNNP